MVIDEWCVTERHVGLRPDRYAQVNHHSSITTHENKMTEAGQASVIQRMEKLLVPGTTPARPRSAALFQHVEQLRQLVALGVVRVVLEIAVEPN
jgi:hypothetical protein